MLNYSHRWLLLSILIYHKIHACHSLQIGAFWWWNSRQLPRNRDVNISAVSKSRHLGLVPTEIIVTDYAQCRWASCWPFEPCYQGNSTLVMECCLMSPSHYLNQCWLAINEAHWYIALGNITESVLHSTHYKMFENYVFENTTTSPRGQWVNSMRPSDAYMHQ